MWLWRGIRSAIFYYVSLTPIIEARHQNKRRREAAKTRKERSALATEHPSIIFQPTPFETNRYWAEEIDAGPGPPKGWRGHQTIRKQIRKAEKAQLGRNPTEPRENLFPLGINPTTSCLSNASASKKEQTSTSQTHKLFSSLLTRLNVRRSKHSTSTYETSEHSAPKNKPSEYSAPKNKISECSAPKNKPSERSAPKNKPSEHSAPKNKPSEYSAPKNKISERSAPKNEPHTSLFARFNLKRSKHSASTYNSSGRSGYVKTPYTRPLQRKPAFEDLRSPIASLPQRREDYAWMVEPLPSAAVMMGRVPTGKNNTSRRPPKAHSPNQNRQTSKSPTRKPLKRGPPPPFLVNSHDGEDSPSLSSSSSYTADSPIDRPPQASLMSSRSLITPDLSTLEPLPKFELDDPPPQWDYLIEMVRPEFPEQYQRSTSEVRWTEA